MSRVACDESVGRGYKGDLSKREIIGVGAVHGELESGDHRPPIQANMVYEVAHLSSRESERGSGRHVRVLGQDAIIKGYLDGI